ncbi:hypothetical protein [Paenibacillus dauci]|uniref:hypothetical protein n=1 Tax=Paenibacillus dauci TaxID=1567106 RepID=UPI0006191C9C|nr:hypothetical protein [Paenibacillus dauci]
MNDPSTLTDDNAVIRDYQLEDWLRRTYTAEIRAERTPRRTQQKPDWKQRAQYAVGHAINRYYSLQPELREIAHMGELLDYRWPRRSQSFESEQHYWDLKDLLTQRLTEMLPSNQSDAYPVMLYEQHQVMVPELGTELSLILQAAWQVPWTTAQPDAESSGHKSLIVQKFFLEHEPQLEEAFIHLSSVFCKAAFGVLPERIELFNIMEGTIRQHVPRADQYRASIDYLHLLRHAVPGGNRFCTSCGTNAGMAYLAPQWSLM